MPAAARPPLPPRGGGAPPRGRAPSCPPAPPPGGRRGRPGRPAPRAWRAGWRCSSPRSASRRALSGRSWPRIADSGTSIARPRRRHGARAPGSRPARPRRCAAPTPCSSSGRGRSRERRRSGRPSRRGRGSPDAAPGAARRPARRRCRPDAGRWRISAFAAATASTVPSSSRCTGPIAVMQATSGGASAASSAIWPVPRIPISTTATSVPSGSPISDIGTPISVLRLPGVPSAATPAARSIATRMSLVVVLPVAPVIPTTRAPLRSRASRPAAWSTATGSGATSTGRRMPWHSPSIQRHADSPTTAAAAPSRSASGACWPPSALSPRTPTNRLPGTISRESTRRALDLGVRACPRAAAPRRPPSRSR